MLPPVSPIALVLLAVCLTVFVVSTRAQAHEDDDGDDGSKPEGDGSFSDYFIYDLMEKVHQHGAAVGSPSHIPGELYAFLSVPDEAVADVVSSSFRRLSLKFHPDKQRRPGGLASHEHEHYKLLTAAADLLRSEPGRRRYRWLLHDAPPWHKSSVMLRHRLFRGARSGTVKFSLGQTIAVMVLFVLLCEYAVRLGVHGLHCIWRLHSRWHLQHAVGAKELKRMRRKLGQMEHSADRLLQAAEAEGLGVQASRSAHQALVSRMGDNMEHLARAQSPLPPFPVPLVLAPLPWLCRRLRRDGGADARKAD